MTSLSAVALKSGIVKTGDELHVRGGRSQEVQMQIDGVPVDDPLGGSMSVGLLGTDNSEVITGGMDAEYGNAQSAIINISTREGGKSFEGQVRYMTDDFGRSDKTYTNYDRLSVGFGGPTPLKSLTYYMSGEATFQRRRQLDDRAAERNEDTRRLAQVLRPAVLVLQPSGQARVSGQSEAQGHRRGDLLSLRRQSVRAQLEYRGIRSEDISIRGAPGEPRVLGGGRARFRLVYERVPGGLDQEQPPRASRCIRARSRSGAGPSIRSSSTPRCAIRTIRRGRPSSSGTTISTRGC